MKFKYNVIFSNIKVKPVVSGEKDKYLSLASALELKKFIPNVDLEKNIDLLPIAFDACVVNRVNKNGDVIDSSIAKQILINFINKPINIEHDRSRVVGVILSANYSKFGTNEAIASEDIEKLNEPFNITLGGVIWKIVNQDLAGMIEESNDPTSENYMNISASWELGFNDYNIVLLNEGQKNLEDGKIISDAKLVEEYSAKLRSNGGNGRLENAYVYRQVLGDVVPLGIGLTTNPAADVKGVVTASIDEITTNIQENISSEENMQNNISQEDKINVNEEGVLKRIFMKIENINQITDELLKQVTASSVTEFIAEEIRKANETFVAEKAEKDNALKTTQEKYETLSMESAKVKEELEKLKAALSKLEEEKVAKEKEEIFNVRMASLDEEYDLSDEDRQVLAADIKDLNEETFSSYMKKMSVLMKEKNKKNKKSKEEKEVKSSVNTEISASATEVVEEVIETSKLEKASIPNSSTPNEASMKEKYSKAFGLEGFDIK